MTPNYSFHDAFAAALSGDSIARRDWGHDSLLMVIWPDAATDIITLPYLLRVDHTGRKYPWMAQQEDLFAHDWIIT